jgi:hypothetical protein
MIGGDGCHHATKSSSKFQKMILSPPAPLFPSSYYCYDWSDIPIQVEDTASSGVFVEPLSRRTSTSTSRIMCCGDDETTPPPTSKDVMTLRSSTSTTNFTSSSRPSPPSPPTKTSTTIQDDHEGDYDNEEDDMDCTVPGSTFVTIGRQERFPTSPVSSMDFGPYGDAVSRPRRDDPQRRRVGVVVSFCDHIQVRTYGVVVGDHPCCELPMQLGAWQSEQSLPLSSSGVDDDDDDDEEEEKDGSSLSTTTRRRRLWFRCSSRRRPLPLSYEERLEVIQASTGLSEEALRRQEYDILHLSSLAASASPLHPQHS